MMGYDSGIVIHESDNMPDDEWDRAHNIEIKQFIDGEVEFLIMYDQEGKDSPVMGYTADKEEAEKIACGILGIHPGFVDLAKRSLETAEE